MKRSDDTSNQNKVKKASHHVKGKMFKKHGKTKPKPHENIGPPTKVESFSANWKKFLEVQQQKDQSTHNTKLVLKTADDKTSAKTENKGKVNGRHNEKGFIDGTKYNTKQRNKKRKRFHEREIRQEVEDSNEIWFDVNPELLPSKVRKSNIKTTTGLGSETSPHNETVLDKDNIDTKENEPFVTRYVAIDCEMVGVGIDGKESVLARVSIVNSHGECLYDKFVASKEKVVDYRTHVSGVSASDLKNATDYSTVQKEVSDLLKDRVLVGHALRNDLKVLMLSHSKKYIRDTAKYKPFQKLLKTKYPALKRLAKEILNQEIQVGEHNSVVDAQVTMQLFKKYKKEWEKSLHSKGKKMKDKQQNE